MSGAPAIALECAGCGFAPLADEWPPFRCPRAAQGDGRDHVLARRIDPAALEFPSAREPHPFVRYRELLLSYHVARARGVSDRDFVALVDSLDRRVAEVDGHGFVTTPFGRSDRLSRELGFTPAGGVWIKDETENVAGSHKARHLMGIALHLEVRSRFGGMSSGAAGGISPEPAIDAPLAIASCGNAALAAAVVARALGRGLAVFVPPDAEHAVVERLTALGAELHVCPRAREVGGDPCVAEFRRAVERGAVPFTCQGSDNGLTLEGGATLVFEILSMLGRDAPLDHVVIQVGGGALASACVQALREARALGARAELPRLHTVQTRGAHPLERAYEKLAARIAQHLGVATAAGEERTRALRSPGSDEARGAELRYAVSHRAEFMWPVEGTPASIATGILDDETYDWHAVVSGLLSTGGTALVVSEERLREANALARSATGIAVSHTGSAGLAGLMDLIARGVVRSEEAVVVIFSGIER